MAKLELVTAPTERLISAGDVATHSRIDVADDDAYLQQLSDSAQDEAEAYTWRKFLTQTWDQYFDAFSDPLYLRYPPLYTTDESDGVTSVKYVDTNGDTQTLATSVYEVAEEDGIAVVRRKYNQTWPSTRGHEDAVIVRFLCGYGTPADVPERIKHAVRLHAGWFYRNREGQTMPDGFHRLLFPYRVMKYQPIGAA